MNKKAMNDIIVVASVVVAIIALIVLLRMAQRLFGG